MGDDDYYSEHFVTQHGLLRQLAVYQAKLDPSKKRLLIGNFGDNLPKCLTEQKHQPIKPRLLSISSGCSLSLTKYINCMHPHTHEHVHRDEI
jgi:hypothetical protein